MKFLYLFIVLIICSKCTSKQPFDQLIWLDNNSSKNNARLMMSEDLMNSHLALGMSKDKTIKLIGFPTVEETEIMLRAEVEKTYGEISETLSNNTKWSPEQRADVLQNWFNQSTLIQDEWSYLLSWTNGAGPFPVYLKVVFLNNKLISSEIQVEE